MAGAGHRARRGGLPDLLDAPGGEFGHDLRHKLGVLRDHCAAAGRDYAEIEKTVGTGLGDVARETGKALDHLGQLADLGFDHAILASRGPWTEQDIAALAAVMPEVHALSPGR